jgi:hypothetical protein
MRSILRPSNQISPEVIFFKLETDLKIVLFPEPLAPSKAVIDPSWISIETPLTTSATS